MNTSQNNLRRAIDLLKRVYASGHKEHWEEGECLDEVLFQVANFLSDIKLQEELDELANIAQD